MPSSTPHVLTCMPLEDTPSLFTSPVTCSLPPTRPLFTIPLPDSFLQCLYLPCHFILPCHLLSASSVFCMDYPGAYCLLQEYHHFLFWEAVVRDHATTAVACPPVLLHYLLCLPAWRCSFTCSAYCEYYTRYYHAAGCHLLLFIPP
jgi:hypothetical protein